MIVRDLYIYSTNDLKVTLLAESDLVDSDKAVPLFQGGLDDCPTELIDEVVYQFKAIAVNEIEVILLL